MSILAADSLTLTFGGLNVLTQVSFEVQPGQIFAIIGPNGAGKTSILNCIGGFYRPQQGRIFFDNHEITTISPDRRAAMGIARTFQNIALFRGMTVLDNIRVSLETLTHNVEIAPDVAERARLAVMRMLEVGRQD